ncbi:MAG: SLBB domain-containing protein [Verrucomicrobiota bacterium]
MKNLIPCLLLLWCIMGSYQGQGAETSPSARLGASQMGEGMAPRVSETLRAPDGYVIQVGDILRVRLLDEGDFDVRTRVGKDGMINLPYVDAVSVQGKSIGQITDLLQKRLAKYYINPLFNLEIVEYSKRYVVVLGQVEKPGMYEVPPLQDSVELMEAIAMAGGATRTGDLGRVVVKRLVDGLEKVIVIDTKAKSISRNEKGRGFALQPGDTIVIQIAKREFVMLGTVRNPGMYQLPPMIDEVTLLEAVGMAGGLNRAGDFGEITVKRTAEGQDQIIRYDAKNLGRNKDVVRQITVKAGDTVTVQMTRSDFSMLGQVRSPGVYAVPDGEDSMNILEAIATAGGATRLADLSDVKVYRKIGGREMMLNLDVRSMGKGEKNKVFSVQAGDKVVIGERMF